MKYKIITDIIDGYDNGAEISTEQYEDLVQRGCPKSWFWKIEEPRIKEGQYFIGGDEVYRIESVDISQAHMTYISIKTGLKGGRSPVIGEDELLSDDEVEQALIQEAKRREYPKAEKWKPLWGKAQFWKPCKGVKGFKYSADEDVLFYGNVGIYQEGNWAEVIEDEWEVQKTFVGMGIYNETTGQRIISFTKDISERQAEAIAKALNNLDNE